MESFVDEEGTRNGSNSEDWTQALARVVPCCLVLKVTQTRAFDTEPAGSSYATGFIVDKARGIILTNRHVVTPGKSCFPTPPLRVACKQLSHTVGQLVHHRTTTSRVPQVLITKLSHELERSADAPTQYVLQMAKESLHSQAANARVHQAY